jgi:hypothetical protein
MKKIFYTLLMGIGIYANGFAQNNKEKDNDETPPPVGKVYTTFGGNGSILSFSNVEQSGNKVNTIPRFTMFFHLGTNYNYDLSKNFGLFSGTNIKNIGLITEQGNQKEKNRVYTLGIPVGFKVGNLHEGLMFFGGAEVDLAFNYKQKNFVDGDKVNKFNEWFSNRTETLMPSVFAGFAFSENFSVKGQFYLNNFFNQNYQDGNLRPYQNTESTLFFVTLGYNFSGKKLLSRSN